jgi:chromosome segregation ATPase
VVGSPVCLRIKKISTGRHVEVNVIRGYVTRIQAIGELFLMFTELLADISKNKRISADEIFRIENQAKVANEFSTTYLDSFREHIHDLEQALIDAASRPGVGKQGENEVANEVAAKLRQELKQLQQRVSSLEELIKTKDAAHERELDEARTMAISGSSQQEMAMAKLQLDLADAGKKISDLEAELQVSEQSLRTAETRLRTTAGISTEMQSRLEESQREIDHYALSIAAAEQLLQQKLNEISKLSATVSSFSERSLRKWIMSGMVAQV